MCLDLLVSKSTIFWRKSSVKRHKSHLILTVKSLWCLCQKVVRTFNFKVFITLLLIALFFKSLKQYIRNTTWNDIWHLNSSKKRNHDLSQIETFSSCWQRSVSKGWKGTSMWLGRFVILSTKSQSITEHQWGFENDTFTIWNVNLFYGAQTASLYENSEKIICKLNLKFNMAKWYIHNYLSAMGYRISL